MSKVVKLNTVTLSEPITIDGNKVTEISLRKPKAGELRGLNLIDVIRMDVAALMTLIPRISTPHMSANQVADLDPAEITDFGTKITAFFVKPAQMVDADLVIDN